MSLSRRALLGVAVAVVAMPNASVAQTPAKVVRIGYLSPGQRSAPGRKEVLEAFKEMLKGHGWVEGKNLLIFAASAPSAQAAKEATATIPIVFSTLNDPARAGFVTSFAR